MRGKADGFAVDIREHANPATTSKLEVTRAVTPRLPYIPGPMFDAGYFDLGMGRGPIARDSRLRNDHPINLCSQLIPMVDTPMSPPIRDKYPSDDWRVTAESSSNSSQQQSNGIHFRGLHLGLHRLSCLRQVR